MSTRQGIALTATLVTILSYCSSLKAAPSEEEGRMTTDDACERERSRQEPSEPGDDGPFVLIRIDHPERLTNFRITLDEDGGLAELEYIEPPRAKPFRISVKPAYAWHDKFLISLEYQLSEFVRNSMPQFGEEFWDILKNEADARKSIVRLYERIGRLIDPFLRNVRPPSSLEEWSTLITGDPVSLSSTGVIVWERMRRRLIGNRSLVSAALTNKGIAHTFT